MKRELEGRSIATVGLIGAPKLLSEPLEAINFVYPASQGRDVSDKWTFKRTFLPQNGFVITSAEFVGDNRAEVKIVEKGSKVLVRFGMASSGGFSTGRLVTRQIRRKTLLEGIQ